MIMSILWPRLRQHDSGRSRKGRSPAPEIDLSLREPPSTYGLWDSDIRSAPCVGMVQRTTRKLSRCLSAHGPGTVTPEPCASPGGSCPSPRPSPAPRLPRSRLCLPAQDHLQALRRASFFSLRSIHISRHI